MLHHGIQYIIIISILPHRNNDIFIEGDKLISYHFACLSIFNEDDYDLWTFNYLSISSALNLIFIYHILKV